MRAEDDASVRAVVRVALTYVGKLVGLFGVSFIIGGLYTLISNDALKHRFLDFVLLLVAGAFLLASGIWIMRRAKRLE